MEAARTESGAGKLTPGDIMVQFSIHSESDRERCQDSIARRIPITISGTTPDCEIRAFTGVVQSVEDYGVKTGPWRWRVTMRESANLGPI